MSLYKNPEAQQTMMRLYDEKLAACGIEYESVYVDTLAGKTHVIISGDAKLPPLVVFHGINAGAPLALEAIKHLNQTYRIYGIDTVGQATRSAETRLPMKGDAYGEWIAATLDGLQLEKVNVLAISYGAFLLQKMMAFQPDRLLKSIFVVPSGFVSGNFWRSMKELSFPLMRFLRSKKESDLLKFMDAFFITKDKHSIEMQKTLLLGFKMDYRRPILVKNRDTANVKTPVYVMVADDDIFFPGDKTLKRCADLFPSLKDTYILKQSKHIPDQSRYAEIEQIIAQWLND
jgi:pimeloyl-ACP methyl ester carboxylesterase